MFLHLLVKILLIQKLNIILYIAYIHTIVYFHYPNITFVFDSCFLDLRNHVVFIKKKLIISDSLIKVLSKQFKRQKNFYNKNLTYKFKNSGCYLKIIQSSGLFSI